MFIYEKDGVYCSIAGVATLGVGLPESRRFASRIFYWPHLRDGVDFPISCPVESRCSSIQEMVSFAGVTTLGVGLSY
jgi:hypothetical protein